MENAHVVGIWWKREREGQVERKKQRTKELVEASLEKDVRVSFELRELKTFKGEGIQCFKGDVL